ncbi:MAG: beta strand repeat-containing protein [Candidatus Spyradosoma sp.]
MRNSKFLLTSLLAAATMSATAFGADNLTITSNTTIADGAEYAAVSVKSGATVTQDSGTATFARLMIHTATDANSESYLLKGGVLNITGGTQAAASALGESDAGLIIGHWGNNGGLSTMSVSSGATLNVENGWTLLSWDTSSRFTIGGEANLYGISFSKGAHYTPTATLTLSEGGRLNLGAGGFANETASRGACNVNLEGGTLGALESWSAAVAMNVTGAVEIDTTKRVTSASGASSAATGDDAGATISLSGNITMSASGSLVVSGTGRLALSGTSTLGSVTVSGGALDLSGATLTLSSAITNNATVTVSSDTVFVLSDSLKVGDTGNTYSLISGGPINGWNSLTGSNFTYYGVGLDTMRSADVALSTAGAVTFSYAAADLTWAGTSENPTWNTSNTNWTNNGTAGTFYNCDNVTFDSSAQNKTVTLENGTNLAVGTMTVESDDYTLSTSGRASVSGSTLIVKSGSSLQIGTSSGSTPSVTVDFDSVSVAGTLKFKNAPQTWSLLSLEDGGRLYIIDGPGGTTANLTINELAVNGSSTIASATNKNLYLKKLSGSGDLAITGNDASVWGGNLSVKIDALNDYSGTLSLSNTAANGGLAVSVAAENIGTTANIVVGANTTLIVNTSAAGTFSLANVTGGVDSTIAVNASSAADSFTGISEINSAYNGALKVTDGFLNLADPTVINGSNIGKIVLAGGTESGLCFVRGSNITVSKDIVAEGQNGGALRSYASNGYTVTFSGTVTGTAIRHYDGGTHTFTNTVSLDSFSAEAGVTEFSGASTTLGTLNFSGGVLKLSGASVSIETLNTSANTVVGTSDSATVKLASGQLSLGVLTLQGNGHSLSVESGTVVSVERFWGSAGGGAITTAISGVLNVSGSVNSADGNAAAFLMANAGGTNTISVEDGGVLNLANAGVSNRDGTGVLNIKTGGEANFGAGLYVLTNAAGWGGSTVNLDGGTLNVGGNSSGVGISTDGKSNVAVNLKSGTLGSLSDSWSTALGFALEGALTVDTTKKEISASGKATATDSGSNVTFEGVISDATDSTGSLKKVGAGTLKLSGNNTFTGGVKLEAGTLELGHNNALGNGTYSALTVTGDSELKLGGGLNVANNVVFDNSAGTVSTLTINVAADTELAGGLLSFDQNEIRKVGAGTLTLSGDNQWFSHGTISIEKGTILAKSANALGAVAEASVNKVRLSGGQLEVGSSVTLAQTNIEIVLSDAYSSTAAITGTGALAAGATITIADIQAAAIAAESALGNDSWTFQIATADSTIATSLAESNFVLAEALQGTWQISDYTNGVLTISSIPEPSAFGLLAGLGALALAGTRRRRKKA